ncbi:MAG: TfoX/Sxy family protein [Thermomicrobiales bacterium]
MRTAKGCRPWQQIPHLPITSSSKLRGRRSNYPPGDVPGGYGIWESGDMFALIASRTSTLYFKVDDETRPEIPGGRQRAVPTMPYWSVPADLAGGPRTAARLGRKSTSPSATPLRARSGDSDGDRRER